MATTQGAIARYVSPEAAHILYIAAADHLYCRIAAAAHPPEIGMSMVLKPFGYLDAPPPLAAEILSS